MTPRNPRPRRLRPRQRTDGEYRTGDLNLDGCIDGSDLATLLALWGFSNPPVGDLNGDGTIDGQDLATFLANWEPCP